MTFTHATTKTDPDVMYFDRQEDQVKIPVAGE